MKSSHLRDDKEQEVLCFLEADSSLQKQAFVLTETWAAAAFFPSKLTNEPSHLIPPCQTAAHIPGRFKNWPPSPRRDHEYLIAVDYADTLRYPIKEIGSGSRAEHPFQCPCCSCLCSFFPTAKATQLVLRGHRAGDHSGSERMQKGAFGKRLRPLQHLS